MKQVEDIIEHVTTTLGDIAQSDVVVGTPLEVGSVTVVPISRISAGFGGAGGEGGGGAEGSKGSGKKATDHGGGRGSGSGGAAVVRPIAVVVLTPDRVEVLPVPEKPGKLEKLIDQVPSLVERLQGRRGG